MRFTLDLELSPSKFGASLQSCAINCIQTTVGTGLCRVCYCPCVSNVLQRRKSNQGPPRVYCLLLRICINLPSRQTHHSRKTSLDAACMGLHISERGAHGMKTSSSVVSDCMVSSGTQALYCPCGRRQLVVVLGPCNILESNVPVQGPACEDYQWLPGCQQR